VKLATCEWRQSKPVKYFQNAHQISILVTEMWSNMANKGFQTVLQLKPMLLSLPTSLNIEHSDVESPTAMHSFGLILFFFRNSLAIFTLLQRSQHEISLAYLPSMSHSEAIKSLIINLCVSAKNLARGSKVAETTTTLMPRSCNSSMHLFCPVCEFDFCTNIF